MRVGSHEANLPDTIRPHVVAGRVPPRRVWGMLALRSALTFALLLAVALAFWATGRSAPVAASAAWWLWYVTITNVVSIGLMVRFARLEGLRLRQIYFLSRSTWRGDVAWALVFVAGSALFAMAPGTLLATALWDDAAYPIAMLFQPVPTWAVYPLFLLMPITQALAELPIYWGYVAPRLRASGMGRWSVIVVVGAVLSVQHLFFSFQPDAAYDLWLALKFLPFALWTGFIVDRRPTALPYLMALHLAIDASLPVLQWMVSTGVSLS
jgi:membrane protease YdiL (CAAX protease family)